MEEQGRPSKKHETRGTKKKEDVEASRALRLEDGDPRRKEETSKRVEEAVRKTRTMPTYRLRSEIKQTTNLKKILEEHVLDSYVTLTLRELFGITKKEFHDTIVDLVTRKRQQRRTKAA